MECPAGGSAAAEPTPSGAEPELAAGCPAEAEEVSSAAPGSAAPRPRCLRAVYVLNDPPKAGAGARSPEAGARQCLLRACEAEGAQLSIVNFGELDFGETAVLDAFYDAGERAGLRGDEGRGLGLGPAPRRLPGSCRDTAGSAPWRWCRRREEDGLLARGVGTGRWVRRDPHVMRPAQGAGEGERKS